MACALTRLAVSLAQSWRHEGCQVAESHRLDGPAQRDGNRQGGCFASTTKISGTDDCDDFEPCVAATGPVAQGRLPPEEAAERQPLESAGPYRKRRWPGQRMVRIRRHRQRGACAGLETCQAHRRASRRNRRTHRRFVGCRLEQR